MANGMRSGASSCLSHRATTSLEGQRRSLLAMLTGGISELEEVGALIEHGRQVGVLMYAEVAQAVSELDLCPKRTRKAARPRLAPNPGIVEDVRFPGTAPRARFGEDN